MSYPLSESFATAPAAGYTAVLGGMSATHNSAQQSIDISAPNSQSILRFNETAHGDFWFEAGSGVYVTKPDKTHIDALDALFAGEPAVTNGEPM
jgi:hypothetical protein